MVWLGSTQKLINMLYRMFLIYHCPGMVLGMVAQANAFTYNIERHRQVGGADSSLLNVVLGSRAVNMTHMNRCAMG